MRYIIISFILILVTGCTKNSLELDVNTTPNKTNNITQNQIKTTKPIKPKKRYIQSISVKEKKRLFINKVLPHINKVYNEQLQTYNHILKLLLKNPKSEELKRLQKEYKSKDIRSLLASVKPHPKSIALAQAAMESAWGRSRFFNEANNIFGIWSFKKDEPRISAGKTRNGKVIWVRKYDSLYDSIKDYYLLLAKGSAYSDFRTLKVYSNDPHKLVEKLNRYSEKGDMYGKILSSIISHNEFEKYDR